MGSSRDWAAKGAILLGVAAVIAESFERIHRCNLIGMGVLPLVFVDGQTPPVPRAERRRDLRDRAGQPAGPAPDRHGRRQKVHRAGAHRQRRGARLLPQRRHPSYRAARDGGELMSDQSGREKRFESDTMGQVGLPAWAYWGAQTQRAVENFSAYRPSASRRRMVRALGLIKKHAARGQRRARPPRAAPRRRDRAGRGRGRGRTWNAHFPIDVFQTGSGTSSNMNANEVIANRANEVLGEPIGQRKPVHPNDHVNRGQSSNDVVPAAHAHRRPPRGRPPGALDWKSCERPSRPRPPSSQGRSRSAARTCRTPCR